jgi:NAD(P)-dependent dehydrogenase (short-subunit alcohol dehydrogenase family)
MNIQLNGVSIALIGDDNPVSRAAGVAMARNGATLVEAEDGLPGILVVSLPIELTATFDWSQQRVLSRESGRAMKARGHGRVLFVLSAIAAIPMRRQPDYSTEMAAALAFMRGLAMELGPEVLVNAVGIGAIGEPLVGGDAAMIGHASVGRAGTVDEVCAALLFLCDPMNSYMTGQMLSVDGGWSVGYGRNF